MQGRRGDELSDGAFQLNATNDTSTSFDLLRAIAAQAVCIGRAIVIDASAAQFAGAATIILIVFWFATRVPGQEYAIATYPTFALAFQGLTIATQRSAFFTSHERVRRIVRFAADYSFSRFLVHLTIVKVIVAVCPWAPWVNAVLGAVCSNAAAIGFAFAFERHYRTVARWIKTRLQVMAQPG